MSGSFNMAIEDLPDCLVPLFDGQKTIADLYFMAQIQLDLIAEQQDGTEDDDPAEIRRWMKKHNIKEYMSREFDAELTHKLFELEPMMLGYTHITADKSGVKRTPAHWLVTNKDGEFHPVPIYCSDAEIIKVITAMQAKGWSYSLYSVQQGDWSGHKATFSHAGETSIYEAYEDTIPLAIAKAALKALDHDKARA